MKACLWEASPLMSRDEMQIMHLIDERRLTNFSFSFDPVSTLFCPQIKTRGPDNWSNICCILLTNSFRLDFETALDNHRHKSGK